MLFVKAGQSLPSHSDKAELPENRIFETTKGRDMEIREGAEEDSGKTWHLIPMKRDFIALTRNFVALKSDFMGNEGKLQSDKPIL